MNASKDTTGLILAGGAGRRVGGRDKGLLRWQGTPLAAHAARRLRPQVGQLLVSCNRNGDYYATLADAIVADSRGNYQGPLSGIEAVIPHVTGDFLIVAPCDTPLLPLDFAERLLCALDCCPETAAEIGYAYDGQREQYLCAAIRTRILPSLTPYLDEGHRTVRHWYARHRCIAVDFSDQAHSFANFNHLQ
jgi:molybdopterin-guanine dinucleotide biosynthesis protein A